MRSTALYQGPLERAIHRFKYENWQALAPILAGLMVKQMAEQVDPSAKILAVPLHLHRQRQRGYNQAQLLADEISLALNISSPPGKLLRVRDTPTQVGLDRVSRRSNVARAFTWRGSSLTGELVLLIDDVATTGATLEACAIALREAGAKQVTAWTLARVAL